MRKTFEEVEELTGTLKTNAINYASHLDDVLVAFNEKIRCEDFESHLNFFRMEKIKGSTISMQGILTE